MYSSCHHWHLCAALLDRNLIFGMFMDKCTLNILVILAFGFWLIWFINQRALYNHALSVIVGVSIGVVISVICAHCPWHRVRHRNFISGIHIYAHMSPIYTHQIFKDSDL